MGLGKGWLSGASCGGEGGRPFLPLCVIPLPVVWDLDVIAGILATVMSKPLNRVTLSGYTVHGSPCAVCWQEAGAGGSSLTFSASWPCGSKPSQTQITWRL